MKKMNTIEIIGFVLILLGFVLMLLDDKLVDGFFAKAASRHDLLSWGGFLIWIIGYVIGQQRKKKLK